MNEFSEQTLIRPMKFRKKEENIGMTIGEFKDIINNFDDNDILLINREGNAYPVIDAYNTLYSNDKKCSLMQDCLETYTDKLLTDEIEREKLVKCVVLENNEGVIW